MASTLLACNICTKKPTFTDVSHLLTHVSSKGHLAQLHKLQVKSHQEIAPSIELAAYNQWFQRHGLAQLLSERLQQKEKKQAVKKEAAIKAERDTAGTAGAQNMGDRKTARGRGRPRRRQAAPVEAKQSAYVATSYPLTPLRDSSSLEYTPAYLESSHLDIDPSLGGSPTNNNANIKLKGKVWPGMALFDAASPDEARRRNQKKDASVVKRMERLSGRVQPAEVTFSAELSPLKSRHIDELEDASSLIEGESPLMIKPKPKPRRKALEQISGNVKRQNKRRAKGSPSPKVTHRRRAVKLEPMLPTLAGGAYHVPYPSAYAPANEAEDDDTDDDVPNPLLPVKQVTRQRFADFTVFEDSPPAPHKVTTHHVALSRSYDVTAPKLSFQTTSWLQPQNQNPLFMDAGDDPYKTGGAVSSLQRIGDPQMDSVGDSDHGHLNPLSWPSSQTHDQSHHASGSSFGPFSGFIAATDLPDPFGLTKNPLADALAQFVEAGKSGFGHQDSIQT